MKTNEQQASQKFLDEQRNRQKVEQVCTFVFFVHFLGQQIA